MDNDGSTTAPDRRVGGEHLRSHSRLNGSQSTPPPASPRSVSVPSSTTLSHFPASTTSGLPASSAAHPHSAGGANSVGFPSSPPLNTAPLSSARRASPSEGSPGAHGDDRGGSAVSRRGSRRLSGYVALPYNTGYTFKDLASSPSKPSHSGSGASSISHPRSDPPSSSPAPSPIVPASTIANQSSAESPSPRTSSWVGPGPNTISGPIRTLALRPHTSGGAPTASPSTSTPVTPTNSNSRDMSAAERTPSGSTAAQGNYIVRRGSPSAASISSIPSSVQLSQKNSLDFSSALGHGSVGEGGASSCPASDVEAELEGQKFVKADTDAASWMAEGGSHGEGGKGSGAASVNASPSTTEGSAESGVFRGAAAGKGFTSSAATMGRGGSAFVAHSRSASGNGIVSPSSAGQSAPHSAFGPFTPTQATSGGEGSSGSLLTPSGAFPMARQDGSSSPIPTTPHTAPAATTSGTAGEMVTGKSPSSASRERERDKDKERARDHEKDKERDRSGMRSATSTSVGKGTSSSRPSRTGEGSSSSRPSGSSRHASSSHAALASSRRLRTVPQLPSAPNMLPAPPPAMYWSKAPVHGAVPRRSFRAHTANLCDEVLWLFGGCDSKGCFRDLYCFDTETMCWSKPKVSGDLPPPRRAHSATMVDKRLFVFAGGDGPSYYNDLYIFDTVSLKWTKPEVFGTPPSPRRAHTSNLWERQLIIFGGGNGVGALNDVYSLDVSDLSRLEWKKIETKGQLPIGRGYHSANLVDGKLIVIGGSDGHMSFNDIHILRLENKTWYQVRTDEIHNRLGHTSTQVGSYLFVVGGHDSRQYTSEILTLNLVNLQWETRKVCGKKPPGRGYHQAWLQDSRLFVHGGFDGKEIYDDLHYVDLAACAYLPQITSFSVELDDVGP